MQTRRELYSLSWKLLNVTLTAVVHLVKPCLNFLHYAMWKVVKFIIPRGGSPASACFGPTKHDRVTVTPTCLTSQRSEARYHRLMGAVWHTGRTPLVYPYWNLQALLRKLRVMSHDSVAMSTATQQQQNVLQPENKITPLVFARFCAGVFLGLFQTAVHGTEIIIFDLK